MENKSYAELEEHYDKLQARIDGLLGEAKQRRALVLELFKEAKYVRRLMRKKLQGFRMRD